MQAGNCKPSSILKCSKRKNDSEDSVVQTVKRVRWDELSIDRVAKSKKHSSIIKKKDRVDCYHSAVPSCSFVQADGEKRPQFSSTFQEDGEEIVPQLSGLLSLYDDVLLMIFSYLSPSDLRHLSETCQRLEVVTRDYTLWTKADFTKEKMKFCALWEYLKFLQPSTTTIAVRGFLSSTDKSVYDMCCYVGELVEKMFKNCPALDTFVFKNFFMYGDEMPLSAFPKTLKHLEFSSCIVHCFKPNQSYFHTLSKYMPELEELVLEDCPLLTTRSLMAISKCPNLKTLKITDCLNVGDSEAYTSDACRFGFSKLEKLDVRRTNFCNDEIYCFAEIATLTHLALECPKSPFKTLEDSEDETDLSCCLTKKYGTIQDCQQRPEKLVLPSKWGVEPVTFPSFSPFRRVPYCMDDYEPKISDRGILSFFPRKRVIVSNIMRIRGYAPEKLKLQHLVVKNYPRIGDRSLTHLARFSHLCFLDVTGTAVTRKGVEKFKNKRPNARIISNFDL